MIEPPRYIEGGSLSATWVQAVEAILARPSRDAFHFFVRALEPLPEIPESACRPMS